MAQTLITNLHEIKLTVKVKLNVSMSNTLRWRLKLFAYLIRFACWIVTIGNVEIVEWED